MKDLILRIGRESDTGPSREHNEDWAEYVIPEDAHERRSRGALFLVADGMGGHQAGEVASQVAVEQVKEAYYSGPAQNAAERLQEAFQIANRALYDLAHSDEEKMGMGTTLVAAVVWGSPLRVTVANVGDSRAYLLHRSHLAQITTDHSWVEAQVQARLLTREQAHQHPQRNLITRALGLRPEVEVDLFEARLRKGDLLLLCTDGLSGELTEEQIAAMLRSRPPAEAAAGLVAQASAQGSSDNASAIVVQAEQGARAEGRPENPPAGWLAVLVARLRSLRHRAGTVPVPAPQDLTASTGTPGTTPGTAMGGQPHPPSPGGPGEGTEAGTTDDDA